MPQRRAKPVVPRDSRASELPPALPQWLAQLNSSVTKLKPHQRIFLGRAVQAVMELTELDETSLVRAAESSRDMDVLLRALESPEALHGLNEAEPLAGALLEGVKARRELIQEEGGAWTSQQAADYLGVTVQAVSKAREAGRLIGLYAGRQGYLYPVWQFDGGQPLPGLREVLLRLSEQDSWMQAIFLLNVHPLLDGKRPLDLLRAGELDAVLDAAGGVGEHGAL